MIQWVITIIVLLAALTYMSWLIYKFFRRPVKGTAGPCDEIHGDCAQCLKHVRQHADCNHETSIDSRE